MFITYRANSSPDVLKSTLVISCFLEPMFTTILKKFVVNYVNLGNDTLWSSSPYLFSFRLIPIYDVSTLSSCYFIDMGMSHLLV